MKAGLAGGLNALKSLLILCMALAVLTGAAAESADLEVGLAVRDISPELPIRLAGYAGRTKAAAKADQPLLAEALALKNFSGERFVFVALDNCEVSHQFVEPVLQELTGKCQLSRGQVALISSHTHSGPVLADTLAGMPQPPAADRERIEQYSRFLKAKLVEVVTAALADCRPALLEHGLGRAQFAMNRRVYQGDKVVFGDNPDGPVDWDVPVLRVRGTNGAVRAIVFGYACHGTSIRTGEDWYTVSPEYMGYARQQLEAVQPGAVVMYFTAMGADADPSPRGSLVDARRHGLELAGAVVGVLDRPMRPVRGSFKAAYEEVKLPLTDPPAREQLEKDALSTEQSIRQRAEIYLNLLKAGSAPPRSLDLPVGVVRIGDDLTFVLMGGEVLVDYSRRLKRLLAAEHPWTIGYAFEVPCYIPSARVIKEGGYETESSLVYYGLYGPFRGGIEDLLVNRITEMAARLKGR